MGLKKPSQLTPPTNNGTIKFKAWLSVLRQSVLDIKQPSKLTLPTDNGSIKLKYWLSILIMSCVNQCIAVKIKLCPRPHYHGWQFAQPRYPMLTKIAFALLSTPATSVPCERMFSRRFSGRRSSKPFETREC